MPHLGMPQAAAGSAHTCGAQALPGHRFLFFLASPLAFLLLRGQLLLGPQSSVRRRVRLLSYSGGHFLLPPFFLRKVFRQLAAANVLAILGECACFCSGGAFSHVSAPPCASIGLELAFTQPWRTLFFGAVRFPPTFSNPQHMTMPSSAACRCRCLSSHP